MTGTSRSMNAPKERFKTRAYRNQKTSWPGSEGLSDEARPWSLASELGLGVEASSIWLKHRKQKDSLMKLGLRAGSLEEAHSNWLKFCKEKRPIAQEKSLH